MELGREGHSGLYTMHFSNLFPCDASASPPSGKSEASSSPPCSLTQFSQWHVLLRMNVENEICFVKGEAKIFSPTPSLASPSARGMQRSGETCSKPVAADGIPIIPIFQKDRRCNVLIEGTYRQLDGSPESTGASTFRLEVHFGRLEAAVLGLSEPEDLHDVVLSCGGYKSCGWHMGTASVMVGGTPIQTPQKLRFLLKPYYGKRCTNCLDPVYAIGYGCKDCQATSYCSRECLNAHMRRGHGLLCPVLKERYGTQSVAVATEVSDDTGLVGWWRCLPNAQYSILVDGGNSLGCAIEFTLCTLRSAKEDGLHYRFILDKDAAAAAAANNNNNNNNNNLPSHESVIDFSCVLLREVNRSAILEGCVSMAAACLNYLYVFSPSAEITVQAHVQFFTAFHCEELDGPISTMEEYVSYARPLHALAALQIEYALKSPIAAEFWRRIKIAKDVIMALFTVNASGPCAGIEAMKDVILTQHCETLTMLSKVFVMMATRAPQEESRKWLDQAEKCLRQFIQNEGTRQSDGLQAIFLFRLSAVLLLYQEPEKSEEAVRLRQQGEALLRAGKLAQESGTEADEHAHATTISAKA